MSEFDTPPTPPIEKSEPRFHRFGLEFPAYAKSFARSDITSVAPGFVLEKPTEVITPIFLLTNVGRFRLSYDHSFSSWTLGARSAFGLGGSSKLSWLEFRATGLYHPVSSFAESSYFVGPSIGIGTLRYNGFFSGSGIGKILFIGMESGYRYFIKRGFDVAAKIEFGYSSANYTLSGLVTNSHWLEASVQFGVGFSI